MRGFAVSGIALLAFALAGGCREEREEREERQESEGRESCEERRDEGRDEKVADEAWDARAAELRDELEQMREEVVRVGEGYDLTSFGDLCRTQDRWRMILRAYQKISDEFVRIRGEEGIALRNRWAHELAKQVGELERRHRLENDTGSYAGIFHLGNKTGLYKRVVKRLLLDSEGLARWKRIEGAHGTIAGVPVAFTNGTARVVLPWRVFSGKPFEDGMAYAPSFDPDHVVTLGGKDYAVVRFPAENNLEGCPATTEESMVFEIVDGRIARIVGLHNFILGDFQVEEGAGWLCLGGRDGYGKGAGLLVDVSSMKILCAHSFLPTDFKADGYGQFLDDENGISPQDDDEP